MVGAGLAVVLDDEDRRVLPPLGVRDRVHHLADGEVTIGDHGARGHRAAGVVAREPHHVEVRGPVLLEVLLPHLVAVEVRDREVERRRAVVRDRVERRDHGVVVTLQFRGDQLGGVAVRVDTLGRAVVLLPRGGDGPALGVEELAIVAGRLARVQQVRPEETGALVAENVLLGVVAADVLAGAGLGVFRVVALHQPVVTLGRVGSDVIGVVVEAELPGQRVLVGRDRLAELGEGRITVALRHVAVDLVIGPVLLDQQEDVLDRRRVAEPLGHRDSLLVLSLRPLEVAARVPPAVLGEDRVGVGVDRLVVRQREPGERGGGAVRAVPCHRGGAGARLEGELGTSGVDAAGVGDDHLPADLRDVRRVVVGRQQADEVHG